MANLQLYLPKSNTDWMATLFTLFGINSICLFEFFYMLPRISSRPGYSETMWLVHVICGIYIYINALGSMWKTIVTDASVRGVMLPTFTKEGWRFCPYCECNCPPRSFHCYSCKICVLRRDHHCVFTGNCVGYKNHRYYLQLVFFCWVAALYSSIVNFDVVYEIFEKNGPFGIFKIVFPFLVYVLGFEIGFYGMLLSGMLLFCMAVMCMMSALLFYHVRNMYYGQITTERTHHIFKYNLGWKENFRYVLGENWRYAWLSAFLPSRLPGDGLEFPVYGEIQHTKDI